MTTDIRRDRLDEDLIRRRGNLDNFALNGRKRASDSIGFPAVRRLSHFRRVDCNNASMIEYSRLDSRRRTTCIVIHFVPRSLFQFFHVFLNGRHAPLPRRMESELLHGLVYTVLLDKPGLITVFQVQSPVLKGFGLATRLVKTEKRSTDLSHQKVFPVFFVFSFYQRICIDWFSCSLVFGLQLQSKMH